MSLVVGMNCFSEGGKRYQPEEYTQHPHYVQKEGHSFDGHGNDIALIRVKGTIEFNDRVQPIEYDTEVFPDDVDAFFTGWGRMEVSMMRLPNWNID